MKKIINVTKKSIKNGSAGDARGCPIALAVNAVLKDKYRSKVFGSGEYGIEIWNSDYNKRPTRIKKVSDKVDKFISVFDNMLTRKNAKPFRFAIEIPKRYVK